MTTGTAVNLPLRGLRVLDRTEADAQSVGRYLADLGADVVLVEPPGGSPGRADAVPFALRNLNKRSLVLDLATGAGAAELLRLAGTVDLLLTSAPDAAGPSPEELLAAHPGLIVVAVTDFGRTGPYRDFSATEAVLAALGGVLSRSGLPDQKPLLPPAGLIAQTAAVHATWAALVAYVKRLRTGAGEIIDVSAFEAVVHGFDPGFGTQGSAAAGRKDKFPRGRPDAADYYPVFRCADGHVRICLLAKRQWRAMFAWLGEPAEFADPKYDLIPVRFAEAHRLHPLIAEVFAGGTRADLVTEGTQRGIPIAAVLSVPEVLAADHFAATGTLVDAEIAAGLFARVPAGYVSIDGVRAGLRTRAPEPGEHDAEPLPPREIAPPAELGLPGDVVDGPLSGLRVLDLGVIVFGAELGRLFADQGADVLKIENAEFPDGLRQTRKGGGMNASFAWGARNKRGLGLDLRSAEGAALFRELVAASDVVAANFKPGTLESLGISRAQLAELNPRIVVSDSSAFGNGGPWSDRMGYGPLVRASCGVSALWTSPAPDGQPGEDVHCDGATVYPDHIAAHVGAIAVLAALIGRARTGLGASVELAQSDVAVLHLGPTLAAGAPSAGTAELLACLGADEWCVVDVRDDGDRARLAAVLQGGELAAWAAERTPTEVMGALQAAGVPAGGMMRLPDELTDPQLTERQSFAELKHPLLSGPIPAGARIARFSTIADPEQGPAPTPGEQTLEIAAELLGLDETEIARLVGVGVLQPTTAD